MKLPNPFHPPPAPPGFAAGNVLPTKEASYLSRLVFSWVTPFMSVGYSRPLEQDDLWTLPDERLTAKMATDLETNFFARCPPEKQPKKAKMEPELSDDSSSAVLKHQPTNADVEVAVAADKKYDSSMLKALHATFFYRWWWTGLLSFIGETLKTTAPLVTRVILAWLTESYVYNRLLNEGGEDAVSGMKTPKGVGYGIGLAFALFVMQEASSFFVAHAQYLGMTLGLYVRAAIIGNIIRKSLRLSGRARQEHSVGQITTMISTDASRFDQFAFHAHDIWIAPVQIILGLGLLIGLLGYSALVGLGVLILGFPLQLVFVKIMFDQRKKGVKFTDARVRLTTEVLQGIRLLKLYDWVDFYLHRIGLLREKELATIWLSALGRSGLFMTVTLLPVLASVLSFITYALSGHDLNVAIIFTSLQFFNVIRVPLLFLPATLSQLSDVLVAVRRVGTFLVAEEMDEPYKTIQGSDFALSLDGDFSWEATTPPGTENKATAQDGKKEKEKKKKREGKKAEEEATSTPVSAEEGPAVLEAPVKEEEVPFALKDLKLKIQKGAFVAIVGGVGSGKSSVLQALIGEMRRTRGEVVFGGSVAYVPQNAWIQNATLRDNIIFGHEENSDRLQEVIEACSLRHDLDVLPQGENTEIGEKGINLSGGQKARVSLARAAYSDADIVLLDDPLAAVDAYVGRALMDQCILAGPLAHRTRILVTHALHVLNKTDYIYVMDNGVITDQGTYEDLLVSSAAFSRLIEEYGHQEEKDSSPRGNGKVADIISDDGDSIKKEVAEVKPQMQEEERQTGTVSWSIYGKYLDYAGGIFWAPVFVLAIVATQAAQVGNSLFLGFWTSQSIKGFSQGEYMGVYAGLGVAQSALSFSTNIIFAFAGLRAGRMLYRNAADGVMKTSVAFFDTTPLGRITSRFSKDQDDLDGMLPFLFSQLLLTASTVLGTVALVFYTFPYLGILFVPLGLLYYGVSAYYQRTSLECKRLDSILRSGLYSSFSETLTGLATIRAYGEQDRAIEKASHGLDMQNRAYYMTRAVQRWLLLRLDLFGNTLVLGISLFAAGYSTRGDGGVDPAKVGVVLTYTLSMTQVLSEIVWMYAMAEQSMNSVERILVYTSLPSEGLPSESKNQPQHSWPAQGRIEFRDVELQYREGLPMVLKGITFDVQPGEKVGIVGRTGAGKSSLIQALFRTVEISDGSITIDGINIQEVVLGTLRQKLALVPQDTTLFAGTLRENLDPMNTRTDAELLEALRRAWLIPSSGAEEEDTGKFNLDTVVSDEGSNFSAGEKQLLALCRALVKNSKIIVLDEATSSVDSDTDSKLQKTIQSEFAESTLICIAHRLNTIAYYDRILVLDGGMVAEYDTVLGLFDKPSGSVFRSLCDEAGLTRGDIMRIRKDAGRD